MGGREAMTHENAMKLALEALMHEMKYVLCCINLDIVPFDGDDFHEALRLGEEALNHCEDKLNMVKQEQRSDRALADSEHTGEPVAWRDRTSGTLLHEKWLDAEPLYTTPQPKHEWVSLTDDEVSIIEHKVYSRTIQKGKSMSVFIAQLAKAIDSALKGKNSA
jgi:hypothetical protein